MSDAEVHFSRLKLMALSPAHYAAAPERDEETPAKRFGSAVHVLSLGGDVICYPGERTGNAWKAFRALVDGADVHVYDGAHRGAAWEWAKAEAGGRPIVTSADVELAQVARELQARRRAAGRYDAPIVSESEYERAQRCASVVRAHPIARELLEGETEVPLRWSYLGRACAGHLDCLGYRRVADLKTASLAQPEWFIRQGVRMAYHGQLAWYREGARCNGAPVDDCYLVAVEPRPPFAVSCLRLTHRALEEGEKLVRLWMERLLTCEASGEWPEYTQSVLDFDVGGDVELIFDDAA